MTDLDIVPAFPMKGPLAVTITDVTLTMGLTDYTHTLVPPIASYIGDRIFCNATSNGSTLTIVLGQGGPDSLAPGQPAASAQLSIAYGKPNLPPPQPPIAEQSWTVTAPGGIGYDGSPLAFTMTLSPDLQTAKIAITTSTAKPEPGPGDASLGFVLIQEAIGGSYRVRWISNDLLLRKWSGFAGLTLIKPDPGHGGIAGPLGVSFP